ncbi:MAG: phage tail sheath C-terminal domain-containing protein [Woeseiaceae bacterium]
MSEAVDHGITVTEIAAMDQPVDVSTQTTAAFVGRALRGPINRPVLVRNFGEYRRRFGDIWARSSLGPAVRQFFDHGGKRLYIVRVANNARGAMICLPASGSAVVLRASEPGSTERIRAAVDYDAIGDDDSLFNLTLQRVNPATGLVDDQELFRKLSYKEDAKRFVGDALLTSTLVRLEHPYPMHRPEPTLKKGRRFESSYVEHAQLGTDGTELTDYDLIGSRKERKGLFALEEVESFDVLYLPPPGKGVDAGPTAILAAELYCRHRGAMLIVDPRAEWATATEAVNGVRELGYASPNMLGYFPRVVKRSNAKASHRPAGGAIAGLLCKQDRTYGPWQDLNQKGMGISRKLRPALEIDDNDRNLLNRAGLNVLANGPTGRARLRGSVTMGRGSEVNGKFANLQVRRFCLRIVNSIAKAARWAVFEPNDATLVKRIRAQVLTYFASLSDVGAFADQHFVVQCDAGVSHRADSERHGVTILLAFHPSGSDEPVSLTMHLTAAGCRVGSTAFAPPLDSVAEAVPIAIT